MELSEIITRICPLPEESIRRFVDETDLIHVRKGTRFIAAGEVCRYVYLVAQGVVRAYCYAKGRDITFWIGEEGTVALSLQSYINGRAGYENITTLEDCALYRIASQDLHTLYRQDIHLANWGRVFAEKEILRAEKSLIPQLFTTGRERYETLLTEQPHLLNRIPLENLASYLGLTPVSLSRIRNEKQ